MRDIEAACLRHARDRKPETYVIPPKEQRVAVVGAGVAGLSCALNLAQKRFRVTVFEKEDGWGGISALASALRRVRRRHRPAVLRRRGRVSLRHGDGPPRRTRRLRRRLYRHRSRGRVLRLLGRSGIAALFTTSEPGYSWVGHAAAPTSWRASPKGWRPRRSSRSSCRPAERPAAPAPSTRMSAAATSNTRARSRRRGWKPPVPKATRRSEAQSGGQALPPVRLRRLPRRLRDVEALPKGPAQDRASKSTPTWW